MLFLSIYLYHNLKKIKKGVGMTHSDFKTHLQAYKNYCACIQKDLKKIKSKKQKTLNQTQLNHSLQKRFFEWENQK